MCIGSPVHRNASFNVDLHFREMYFVFYSACGFQCACSWYITVTCNVEFLSVSEQDLKFAKVQICEVPPAYIHG